MPPDFNIEHWTWNVKVTEWRDKNILKSRIFHFWGLTLPHLLITGKNTFIYLFSETRHTILSTFIMYDGVKIFTQFQHLTFEISKTIFSLLLCPRFDENLSKTSLLTIMYKGMKEEKKLVSDSVTLFIWSQSNIFTNFLSAVSQL